MTENTTPDIKPLTEEELIAIVKRLEEEKEFDSDLARAVFTLMVSGYEYQQLYTTLQAYYAASAGALHDLAGACAATIGLKDHKKIQKMYKLAGKFAGEVPNRAIDILQAEVPVAEEPTQEK
jgi:hypothetical protein